MKKNEFAFDIDDMSPEYPNDKVELNWLQRHVAGDKLSELKSHLEDKQRQISDIEQSNQKLLKELEASKKRQQDSIGKLKEYTELIEKLYRERDQFVISIDNINNKLISRENEIKEYQNIKDTYVKYKEDLKNDIGIINGKLKSVEAYGEEQEMINKKNQKEIKRLNEVNQELQAKLEQVQEEYRNITNEKKETNHQVAIRQEEMHAMRSRLEQHEDEMQQQAAQFHLAVMGYRQSLRNVQLTGSLALSQVMGAFSAALVRSVFTEHAPVLLADYAGIADATDALRACGQWFADLQLCADFDLHQEDGALACAWRAPHSDGDAAMANEWVVGMLWALLNTKTEQQWSCHHALHDETLAMQAVFRPIHA